MPPAARKIEQRAFLQDALPVGRPGWLGGVVPPQDYEALYASGAAAIFPPGTVIAEAAVELLQQLGVKLGHNSSKAASA